MDQHKVCQRIKVEYSKSTEALRKKITIHHHANTIICSIVTHSAMTTLCTNYSSSDSEFFSIESIDIIQHRLKGDVAILHHILIYLPKKQCLHISITRQKKTVKKLN
ncbi:hypothetical protein TorRG33x02_094770 [Trema orientale]|uniref:Uncharacterized protein n=1 Tax=Trema orientale TaxID=63057 RepID=A0A2P5FA76_TREOI|nr:hypothetical protein TorRG33x02_094770 [Trema orientale]